MSGTSELGTALVTGASSGIGATYAEKLAARGYDLILVARDAGRLQALADRLAKQHGVRAEVLRADLTHRPDVVAVDKRLREDISVTLLVNNAGIGSKGPLLRAEAEDLDQMVDLNVAAANRLAVAAAQAFVTRSRGAIINIASVASLWPQGFTGTYAASKGFMLTLTESLASELSGTGVRIQAVMPGLTRTELLDRAGRSFDSVDPKIVMDVGDMVEAALAGFDAGELITVPSLADRTLYDRFDKARADLQPFLSLSTPAPR